MNRSVYQQVPWRDLVAYHRGETLAELLLPLPWLIAALTFANANQRIATAACVIYVFLLGLRVAHNAFHRALGLPRMGDHLVMFAISLFMLGSSHAIGYTHIHHHKHCCQQGDVEGELARLSFWRALLKSPLYPVYIHIAALKNGSGAEKRWIIAELGASISVQLIIHLVLAWHAYALFTGFMLLANVIAPMIGIWSVHHGAEHHPAKARSCRKIWLNRLTAGMFYHAEHHLFPAVPTRNLAALAKRLDNAEVPAFLPVV
ncbi:MAG TPA: fatty acid desaturase [Marinagarivorans sp.]